MWSETFIPTIGVDFKIKSLEINDKLVKMQIWDTAGEERFRTVIASYFKGSHGILLIYDITNKTSFKELDNWLSVIENNASQNVLKILIGNKSDLEENREVTKEEGQAFAKANNMQFMETSAKMNTNVSEAFEALAKIIMEFNSDKNVKNNRDERKKSIKVSSGQNIKPNKKCC